MQSLGTLLGSFPHLCCCPGHHSPSIRGVPWHRRCRGDKHSVHSSADFSLHPPPSHGPRGRQHVSPGSCCHTQPLSILLQEQEEKHGGELPRAGTALPTTSMPVLGFALRRPLMLKSTSIRLGFWLGSSRRSDCCVLSQGRAHHAAASLPACPHLTSHRLGAFPSTTLQVPFSGMLWLC